MTLEQQLSKVRMFQTEVSMLRTRLLDCCRTIEPDRATFCSSAAQSLQEALERLVLESRYIEALQGKLLEHQKYCDTFDEFRQPL